MIRTLLLIAVALTLLQSLQAAEPAKPNIVLIFVDDMGYGDLGCYGNQLNKTPNIDRIAREGMRFTQHYCGNAVCAPSRCSLMTGKHPGHAYVRNNGNPKLPEAFMAKYGLEFAGQHPIPDAEVTIAANALQTLLVPLR